MTTDTDIPTAEPVSAATTVAELAVPTGPAAGHVAPARVALARTRTGQRAIVGSLVAFAGLFALVRANRSAFVDQRISREVQRRGAPVAPLLRAVSWPGFPPQSRLIPPLVTGALWALGLRLEALFQLGAWSGALLSTGLKALARRPRPSHADAIEVVAAPLRGTSFPSGHVLTYVGFYGFLAHLVGSQLEQPRVRRFGVAALVSLVGLVGPSRVHEGHHWPSDVLGSYLVGLPLLAVYVEAYREAKVRLLRARRR